MQTTKLVWGALFVVAATAVGAAACAVLARSEMSTAQDRIDRLERDIKAVGGNKAKGLADEVDRLKSQLSDLEKSLALAHDSASKAEKHATEVAASAQQKIDVIEQRVANAPTGGGGGVDAATLEEVVNKKLEEKGVQAGGGNGDEKRKPPLAELSRELGLTPSQEDAVAESVNAGKKRIAELLQIKRADGTCMMDELIAIFTDPATGKDPGYAKTKMTEIFARLFTEPIPGRGEPYIAEVLRIQGDVKQRLEANMSADQYKQLERSNVDVTEIQTGYDPFAEYLAQQHR